MPQIIWPLDMKCKNNTSFGFPFVSSLYSLPFN